MTCECPREASERTLETGKEQVAMESMPPI